MEKRWNLKLVLLAVVLVVTGSLNTLSAKWTNLIKAENSDGEVRDFNHPFFQADCMFIGEILCLVAFYVVRVVKRMKRRQDTELAPLQKQETKFNVFILYAPAFCDMVATSVMYVGLTLTFASSFQMLRGAVIVFTALMSVAFLGRKLEYFRWIGIVGVIIGLLVVGVSDFLSGDQVGYTTNGIITGDLLIITAQIVTATQMVLEEKFVNKFNVPALQCVGWEGIFGFTTLTILLVPMYYIPAGIFSGNPRGVLEDALDAFVMIGNEPLLLAPLIGNIISIAFFNFAGVSVTKELSATTRMVLDSVRTLVVWIFSLAIFGQKFHYLQPIGFIVLIIGMFIYNNMFLFPFLRKRGCLKDGFGSEQLSDSTSSLHSE